MEKTILVVEDDLALRETICLRLEHANFKVVCAGNGLEAMQRIEKTAPEMVITDIIMPDADGIELIRNIKKEYPQINVLAVSGGGRIDATDYLNSAKRLGAQAVLAKPFTNKELIDAVNEVILASETTRGADA